MNEPWFDPMWAWVPGTILGVFGGLWGTLLGVLGSKGTGKTAIWVSYWLLLAIGAVLLALGIAAVASGQPYGIWYGLLLPGVLLLLVVGPLGLVFRKSQRMAEQRKMQAQEFE